MSIKYLAIGSLLALGIASPAMAGVNQTVTGIQQSDQFQYAEGDGDILQNSTNIQNLDQRADVYERRVVGRRGHRGFGLGHGRRDSVQQTVTGVQTNIQEQEGLGFGRASDIIQNSNNVNLLDQNTAVRRFRRSR
ncbi:MAG: hypothetical protein AAF974_00180 [Cyanobacteria bacterium P01_E01_bin.34]